MNKTQSVNLNGVRVVHRDNTIFIPLPRELWRSCGRCDCSHCQGKEGFWDTIAVAIGERYSWTVHMPEAQ